MSKTYLSVFVISNEADAGLCSRWAMLEKLPDFIRFNIVRIYCGELLDEIMTIGFDEALDYATLDLMDAFLGSGAATNTFGGDLSFDSNVTFTKQDLKPLLRQAIITWINTKAN